MSTSLHCRHRRANRAAFTVTELLVLIAVTSIVLAALLPMARRLASESGQVTSTANLQQLAFAHAMYGVVHNGRQPTWIPDDFGLAGGNPQTYATLFGCPPSHVLGSDVTGAIWGYWLPCALTAGQWQNIEFAVPLSWSMPGNGSFRSPGSKAFSGFVDNRYYTPRLYAPNDTVTHQLASALLDFPGEFTLLPAPSPALVFSSYAFSPAAMWHPSVLAKNESTGAWWTNPQSIANGYQSPGYAQCLHPDLKTLMIEHNWNFGQPGPINEAFAGGQTPYFFSHGIAAAPLTLFYDGRVGELPNAQVAADDAAVLAGTRGEVGLWSRDTPQGINGYYGAQSFDGFVTGHHVFTADGIHGRDILTVKPSGGVAAGAARGSARRPGPASTAAATEAPLRLPTIVPQSLEW